MAVRQITTRLAIDGEQEYKKQLAAVNRELGNLGAEMKLVDAQFKGQANSSEALRAKHNLLKQSIEQQVGKIVSLQGAVEEAAEAYGEADSRTDSYRRQLLSAETALAKLNDELSENDKLLKEAEDSADGCAKSIDGFGKAVKETADDADSLNDDLGGIGGALKGLRNEDGSFNLGGVTSALSNLKGLLVGGAIVTGAKAVKDAIFEIVESTEEYRKIMGTLEVSSAAAGYTAEETAQVYQELQAVLGDTQAAATATANLQALGLKQEDLLSSGEVLMDLTQDTVVADKLLKGFTAHGKDGAPITGSCEFDADTGDATAGAAEILTGKTAYVTGSKVTGTMPNNGAKTLSITEKGKPVTIPQGYHDGSGKAQIDAAEEAKLIPANIREGITVLGVLGTMSGSEGMKPQAKSVTPTFASQEVLPDEEYNCLSSVTVAAIPIAYTDNAQGGKTVTIG